MGNTRIDPVFTTTVFSWSVLQVQTRKNYTTCILRMHFDVGLPLNQIPQTSKQHDDMHA